MKSKFPFSMENIPRQRSFACLSLKFGCILSGLVVILYSMLALAQCLAVLGQLTPKLDPENLAGLATYGFVISIVISHAVTLFLSTVMLVGVLREKHRLIKPWIVWTSIQVIIGVLLFVFWTAMSMINHNDDNSLLLYVLEFLALLVRFYMLMIVASYYKQLEDDKYELEKLRNLVSYDTWYSSA